jgi:hypothetical protein
MTDVDEKVLLLASPKRLRKGKQGWGREGQEALVIETWFCMGRGQTGSE